MAAPEKKGAAAKGRKNRKVVKTHAMYESGKLKKKTCPKCGAEEQDCLREMRLY